MTPRLPRARGRLAASGMNKIETDYARHLELRKQAGEVLWWRYEGIRLRLAKNNNLTPDFAIMLADGTIELHDTKGSWKAHGQRDQKSKMRLAAEMFPFRIVAVMRDGKTGWKFEEF